MFSRRPGEAALASTAGEGMTYYGKRLFALVLGDLKLPLFQSLAKDEATIDAHGYDNTVRLVFGKNQERGRVIIISA